MKIVLKKTIDKTSRTPNITNNEWTKILGEIRVIFFTPNLIFIF